MARDATPQWEKLTEAFENGPGCSTCTRKTEAVQGICSCPECGEVITDGSTANMVSLLHTHLNEAHPEVAYRY
jgi:ribosomal protein L37AE/L43A